MASSAESIDSWTISLRRQAPQCATICRSPFVAAAIFPRTPVSLLLVERTVLGPAYGRGGGRSSANAFHPFFSNRALQVRRKLVATSAVNSGRSAQSTSSGLAGHHVNGCRVSG